MVSDYKEGETEAEAVAAWNRRTPDPGTSVVRWVKYDGTPETLPERNHCQVLFFRKGETQGTYFYHKFGEHIELLSYGEQIIPKKGDLWAYFPEPPEGMG